MAISTLEERIKKLKTPILVFRKSLELDDMDTVVRATTVGMPVALFRKAKTEVEKISFALIIMRIPHSFETYPDGFLITVPKEELKKDVSLSPA